IPEARIDLVNLTVKPDETYSILLQPRLNPATGEDFPLGYDSIALNPYTGEEIERNPKPPEQDGYFPLTRKNILQFVYALHYQLALGEVGMWLFGLAVIVWTVDCFVGFYLTLPPRRKQFNAALRLTKGQDTKSFWQRWQIAWKIKWPASFFRVNFDLHRAFGLWLWLMLFIFAWSSVMLEIHVFDKLPPVYDKVMQTFFDYPPEEPPRPELAKSIPDPAIDFRTAHAIGQKLMQEQSEMRHFTVKQEVGLYYDQSHGDFQYIVNIDREMGGISLAASVKFDATTGKLLWSDPIAAGDYSGLAIKSWLFSLHMALIWGLPYKILVCLMGLVITMLSVTGVYIWFKKRRTIKRKRKNLLVW
ncbi:MAG: PepSY domain-containing protein, partial [Methyloglobulus sp.]|nr:PepSY domain-containing protein [Methyloglobulus sp.]